METVRGDAIGACLQNILLMKPNDNRASIFLNDFRVLSISERQRETFLMVRSMILRW